LVILVGVLYFVIGKVFAALANPATSEQLTFMWRLVPWVTSALLYGAHIGYEHCWLNNSARTTALHAAAAVGIGAFLLAVAATIHAVMVPTHAPYRLFLLALVVWPIITALPAFLVALAAAAALAYLPIRRGAD
jgi:hypothetical protein